MNIITKAIQDVRYSIPKEVLDYAFLDTSLLRSGIPITVDQQIREKVIQERVLVDCNLYAVRQVEVPLTGLRSIVYPEGFLVYHIPKERTSGCSIVSVLSVTYGVRGYGHGHHTLRYMDGTSQVQAANNAILDASLDHSGLSTAKVSLIGENIIAIKEALTIPDDVILKCNIAYDAELSTIKPASWRSFGKLVEYAVKAYIYINKTVIVDTAVLHGGLSLGRIGDLIENYSDANEMYNEHLEEVWRKVAFSNDDQSMQDHIASQISIQK